MKIIFQKLQSIAKTWTSSSALASMNVAVLNAIQRLMHGWHAIIPHVLAAHGTQEAAGVVMTFQISSVIAPRDVWMIVSNQFAEKVGRHFREMQLIKVGEWLKL